MDRNFDQNLVYSFFRMHPLMTLTTISEDGTPQNSVVYVYMDDKMNCFCATRSTTRKFTNLENNNKAVLSTYDENLLMFGELLCSAEIIKDSESIVNVLPELQKIISSRHSSYWVPPVSQLEGDGYIFIKLTPKKVNYVNYEKSTSNDPEPHRVEFEV